MKIKYILWVICALLLLNTSVTFAQDIGRTSTVGEVGFLEKEPIDKPPETSSSTTTSDNKSSTNQRLPIVGSGQNELLMPIAIVFVMIGSGGLVMKKTKQIRIKENFNEKNND